jgi:hypothetical protein
MCAPVQTFRAEEARNMHYRIELAQGYIRAELSERKTAEESLEFIKALTARSAHTGCARVLVSVRKSRPIFKINSYGITQYFRQVAETHGRVALVSDSDEMRSSQQYIEMLGREQGAAVRAFRDESAAIEWLSAEG